MQLNEETTVKVEWVNGNGRKQTRESESVDEKRERKKERNEKRMKRERERERDRENKIAGSSTHNVSERRNEKIYA